MYKETQCFNDLALFQVAQQCKENIFAIQTLKDFQYFEDSKDQGMNVREKAKQLVLLLKDDERLRNERARALKAKERFAQAASGFGSEGMVSGISVLCTLSVRFSCYSAHA
jgi:epsin